MLNFPGPVVTLDSLALFLSLSILGIRDDERLLERLLRERIKQIPLFFWLHLDFPHLSRCMIRACGGQTAWSVSAW